MKPQVTIAIPVYNSAATLVRCVRSAMAQTMNDIEIIIADDASTDDSAAIAEKLAAEDGRIRVMRMGTNGGKSRAMNAMAEAARGTWFAVLDADDVYHPERLERMIAAGETHDLDVIADNLEYYDAGVDRVLRPGFDPAMGLRFLDVRDLLQNNSSFAEFDFGLLKPVIRKDFIDFHRIAYTEKTRLAEDFYYLLEIFVAGGRCGLLAEPLYRWTLPFGTVSRKWTNTGSGAWRYDYRQAIRANDHYIGLMAQRNQTEVVAMLRARGQQYRVMVHYIDAQRAAASGSLVRAGWTILRHPSTYRLLTMRIIGRLRRSLSNPTMVQS